MRNNRGGFPSGHITQFIALLGGVWLFIAPTWVGFFHHHKASHIDQWAGAVLIVVSVASFFLQWAFGLRDRVQSRMAEAANAQNDGQER